MLRIKNRNLCLLITAVLTITIITASCADSTEESITTTSSANPTEVIMETPDHTSEIPETENPSDWTESTHSNNVEPDYDVVFDQSTVLEFNIVIDSVDWQALIDDAKASSTSTNNKNKKNTPATVSDDDSDNFWVTADITFNGITWENVGIRFKGNSSLRSVAQSDNLKYSFKLDFDEFEDEYPELKNQRFYGFKQLNLNNNYSDETLMHDKIAADLFREFGIASARTAYCVVNVDYGEGSQYFGVYTLIEEMDDTGIEDFFGTDSGNLYKPEGRGATFADGSYNDSDMELKNNEEEADYSDVMALYEIINSEKRQTDYESWKSELESIFDTDIFLKWLAANTAMQNWDSYGTAQHNYYLYNDPETGQLNWIPWDNNEAFKNGKKDRVALSLSLDEVSDMWPLIRYIIDVDEYREAYEGYLQMFIDEVFYPEKMIETYEEYYEMLKEYAYAEQDGYTFLQSEKSFDTAVEALMDHVVERYETVRNYLSK